MPTYDYECQKCGVFEVEQRMSDDVLKECPHCKEKGKTSKVERLLSAPALSFKGSGFYITDYNKNPATGAASAQASSDTKTESTASKPTEAPTKPKSPKE